MCTGMYDLLYVSEEEKEERVMENIVEKGKEMTKKRKETGEAREVKVLAKKRKSTQKNPSYFSNE